MLDSDLVPTRLIETADRPRVVIAEPRKPGRYWVLRSLSIIVRWAASLVVQRLHGKMTRGAYARRLGALLEELGGIWIRAGQLLALRVDMFSEELCRELSRLYDRSSGFPATTARTILEEDLGGPLDALFDYFEETPFIASSVGQIHRAHLKYENEWVAVKVQRPHLERTVQCDLKLIRWTVRLLRVLSLFPGMRWDEAVAELQQFAVEDTDFRYEAAAMRRMRKTLRKHNIYVPKVFSTYLARRVLVSEFVHAALMADFIKIYSTDPLRLAAWLQENNIDPHLVAKRLVLSLFRQLFEDNAYHSGLHPGNIILLRNSRVAFIDLRSIGFTEREFLHKMRLFSKALASLDYSKAADISFLLVSTLPAVELDDMKHELIRMLKAWTTRTMVRELPYHEKSMNNALVGVAKIMFRHRIIPEWAFLRIRRTLTTLDSALIHLFRDANYTRLIQEYFLSAERRELERKTQREIVPRILKGSLAAMDLQESAYEYLFYQGSIIRRQAQVFEGTTSKFSHFLAKVCGQVAMVQLAVGIALTAVLVQQYHPAWIEFTMGYQISRAFDVLPRLDVQVWLLILLADLYFFRSSLKLRKRLAEKDIRLTESRATW